MTNKERYEIFCQKIYVPIYSKPWWMDAVCGAGNWNVWIYGDNLDVVAAMPYYVEQRGDYRYITKAPLTQNNGIIFKDTSMYKECSRAEFEEKVIDAACEYITSLGVDVYEQQYPPSFTNYLPFYWNGYSAITRYTYVLEDTSDMEKIWSELSSNYRNKIRKGRRSAIFKDDLNYKIFFDEHEKIFQKQGLPCPFSFKLWERLYKATIENGAGKIIYATNERGDVCSLMFLVWDEKKMYPILGGGMPEYLELETYDALIWEAFRLASEKSLQYDFEGSVIKRISKSFRQFGGVPMPYFRIRKIFNPQILQMEYEQQRERLLMELEEHKKSL